MRFSPTLITSLLIHPLRTFFSTYTGPDLKYDPDEKLTKIEIDSINNFNKIAVQMKPRIIVNRGSFAVDHSGLTDNLAQGKSIFDTKGVKNDINMVFIKGQAQILVESRQEGAMELIVDMVTHFLVWSRPQICNTQGFKDFAMPLSVSDPRVVEEDREIFQTVISVPYLMEEQWTVNTDALKINDIYMSISA